MGDFKPPGTVVNGWTLLSGNSEADYNWCVAHPKKPGYASREELERNDWYAGNTQENVPKEWINTPMAGRTTPAPIVINTGPPQELFGHGPVSPEVQTWYEQQLAEREAQQNFWETDEFRKDIEKLHETGPHATAEVSTGFTAPLEEGGYSTPVNMSVASPDVLAKFLKQKDEDLLYTPVTTPTPAPAPPPGKGGGARPRVVSPVVMPPKPTLTPTPVSAGPNMSRASSATLEAIKTAPVTEMPGQYLYLNLNGELTNFPTSQPVYKDPKTGKLTITPLGESNRAVIGFTPDEKGQTQLMTVAEAEMYMRKNNFPDATIEDWNRRRDAELQKMNEQANATLEAQAAAEAAPVANVMGGKTGGMIRYSVPDTPIITIVGLDGKPMPIQLSPNASTYWLEGARWLAAGQYAPEQLPVVGPFLGRIASWLRTAWAGVNLSYNYYVKGTAAIVQGKDGVDRFKQVAYDPLTLEKLSDEQVFMMQLYGRPVSYSNYVTLSAAKYWRLREANEQAWKSLGTIDDSPYGVRGGFAPPGSGERSVQAILERDDTLTAQIRQRDAYRRLAWLEKRDGDYEQAREYLKKAILLDSVDRPLDPYYFYSWTAEPWRKEPFINAVVEFELKMGRPLKGWEIMQIAERFVNPDLEMVMGSIFDVTNLLPIPFLDKIFGGAADLLGKIPGKLKWADEANRNVAARIFRWNQRRCIESEATWATRRLMEPFERMAGRTEAERSEIFEILGEYLGPEKNASRIQQLIDHYGLNAWDLRNFERVAELSNGQWVDDLLKKKLISPERADRLREMCAHIAPGNWKMLAETGTEVLSRDALDQAISQTARRLGVEIPEIGGEAEVKFIADNALEDAGKVSGRKSLAAFAGDIRESFLRAHRPISGVNLYNDSFLYYIASKMGYEATNTGAMKNIRRWVSATSTMRNVWVFATLALRPAWFARNVIDSTFRMALHGTPGAIYTMAHIYDLLPKMRKTMNVGAVTAASASTITTIGGDLRHVVDRVLAGERFSRLVPFKFMKEEWAALRAAGAGRRGLFKLFGVPADAIKAFGKGFTDLNTIFETTARISKVWEYYHPRYTKMANYDLARLVVKLMDEGTLAKVVNMDDLVKNFRLLWEVSGGDTQMYRTMLDRLLGEAGEGEYLSLLMNNRCLKAISGLPEDMRQPVVMDLIEHIESRIAKGRNLDAPHLTKFFDDYADMLKKEWAKAGDATANLRGAGVDSGIPSAPEGVPTNMRDATRSPLVEDSDVAYFMHDHELHPGDPPYSREFLTEAENGPHLTTDEVDDLLQRNVLNEVYNSEGKLEGLQWNPRMQGVYDAHVVRPDIAAEVAEVEDDLMRQADEVDRRIDAANAASRAEGELKGEAADALSLRMKPKVDRAPIRKYVTLRQRWAAMRKEMEVNLELAVKANPKLQPRLTYLHELADNLVFVNTRAWNWMKFDMPGPLTGPIEFARSLWTRANEQAAFLQRGTNLIFERTNKDVIAGVLDKELAKAGGHPAMSLQEMFGPMGLRLEVTGDGIVSARWFDDLGDEVKGWGTTSQLKLTELQKKLWGGNVYASIQGRGRYPLPAGSLKKLVEDVPFSYQLIRDLDFFVSTGQVRGDVALLFDEVLQEAVSPAGAAAATARATTKMTTADVVDKFAGRLGGRVEIQGVDAIRNADGVVIPGLAGWLTNADGSLKLVDGKPILQITDAGIQSTPEALAETLQHELGHLFHHAYPDDAAVIWGKVINPLTGQPYEAGTRPWRERIANDFRSFVNRGSCGTPEADAFFSRVMAEDAEDELIGEIAYGLPNWARQPATTPHQRLNAKSLWSAYTARALPDGSTLRQMYGGVKWHGRDVLESPQTFVSYLQDTLKTTARIGYDHSSLLALREQLDQITRFLNYADTHWETLGIERPLINKGYRPAPIREQRYSRGTMTWLLDNQQGAARQAQVLSFLDEMKTGMLEQLAANPQLAVKMGRDQLDLLAKFGQEAIDAKNSIADIALHGGQHPALHGTWDGALPLTNEYMLDYGDFSRFDKTMKGIYPFWMFPSRSFALWSKYCVTHPWLPALYAKYVDWTKRSLIAEGFYNTQGDALPSMVGNMRIPGTDIWFNPLSAMSFRFPIMMFDRVANYEDEEYSELNPLQSFLTKFAKIARVANLDLPPWISWPLMWTGAIDANSLPNYAPMAPLQLIPRTGMMSFMEKVLHIENGAALDFLHPDVGWKDYLIEVWMYADSLQTIMNAKTDDERWAAVGNVQRALGYEMDPEFKKSKTGYVLNPRENDPYWQKARSTIEREEYFKDLVGYFTGIFPKPNTDALVLVYAMRNYRNWLRDMINDEMGADLFNLEPDSEARYVSYVEKGFKTPMGAMAGFYNAGRFVQSTDGKPVYGQDRRELMAIAMHEDAVTSHYYDAVNGAIDRRISALEAVPHGARSSVTDAIWQTYFDERNEINNNPLYEDARLDWMVGHKPESLVYDHYRQEFWLILKETFPDWDQANDESYADWQARVTAWKEELPHRARQLIDTMMKDNVNRSLRDRQGNVTLVNAVEVVLTPSGSQERFLNLSVLKEKLLAEATPEGYEQWRKDNRTLYSAQDAIYDELYTNKYYEDTSGLTGYPMEYAQAQWLATHTMPTDQQILDAMHKEYGDRWTDAEIMESWEKSEKMSLEDRMRPTTQEEATAQEVWDVLSWIGLGSNRRETFNKALVMAGGDPASVQTWYDTNGYWGMTGEKKVTDKYIAFHDSVVKAGRMLGLEPFTVQELKVLAQAQTENKQFQELVETKYGEDFYQLLTLYGITSNKAEKKLIRTENKEIDGYYDLKEEWGCQHLVWAQFYYPDLVCNGVPVTPGGTATRAGGAGGGGGGGGAGGAGGGGGGGRGGTSVAVKGHWVPIGMRRAGVTKALGSGGASVKPVYPAGFVAVAGPVAVAEIERFASGQGSLSNPTIQWLTTLKLRHKEWSKFLDALLKDVSTVST